MATPDRTPSAATTLEQLVARIEELEGDLALTRKEKSILMRELSRFTGNA